MVTDAACRGKSRKGHLARPVMWNIKGMLISTIRLLPVLVQETEYISVKNNFLINYIFYKLVQQKYITLSHAGNHLHCNCCHLFYTINILYFLFCSYSFSIRLPNCFLCCRSLLTHCSRVWSFAVKSLCLSIRKTSVFHVVWKGKCPPKLFLILCWFMQQRDRVKDPKQLDKRVSRYRMLELTVGDVINNFSSLRWSNSSTHPGYGWT